MQMDSSDESYLHITPLPGNMRFYDGNQDGYLTLKEFARTLGHNPRAKHVRGAFNAVDRNSKFIPPEAYMNNEISTTETGAISFYRTFILKQVMSWLMLFPWAYSTCEEREPRIIT